MRIAFAVGLASLTFGFEAIADGGMRNGMPAFPFFMFGVLGVLAGVGDVRMLRWHRGRPRARGRVRAHP